MSDLSQAAFILVAVISVIVIAVVVAVMVHAVRRASARGRRHLVLIGAYLGKAEKAVAAGGSPTEASLGGIDYRYTYVPERGLNPDQLTITRACEVAHDVVVRHERPGDRAARRIGLVREVQTGDAHFDRRYFIDTPEPAFAARLLADAEVRALISAILAGGFDRVVLRPGEAAAVARDVSPLRPSRDDMPLALLLSHLGTLAARAPKIPARAGRDRVRAWRRLLVAVYTVAALVGVIGFAAGAAALHFYPLLDGGALIADALVWSLLPIALSLVLLVLLLRGHSATIRHLLGSGLLAIVGWGAFSAGGMAYVNGAWDESVTRQRAPQVLERRRTYGRSPRYWVEVGGWRRGRPRERVYLSHDEFLALHPRLPATVLLDLRDGYLDHPWIARYRFPSSARARSVTAGDGAILPRFHD